MPGWKTVGCFVLEWVGWAEQTDDHHLRVPKNTTTLLCSCLIFILSFVCSSRFKKAFESEPTLQSGINYAVLLLAAGHQFDTSFELRKVGNYSLLINRQIRFNDSIFTTLCFRGNSLMQVVRAHSC